MLPKWIYYGVHHDPHPRFWLPGMVEAKAMGEVLTSAMIEASIPPASITPFEVRVTLLPDNAMALAWRERWKTQLSPDPVASLFVTSVTDQFTDVPTALAAAQAAFPEVWKRFEKLTIGETCNAFAPPSSEASASITSEMESPSKPEKASAKSSA